HSVAPTQRKRQSANRAGQGPEEQREDSARPSQKRTDHRKQPHISHPDAFTPAHVFVKLANQKQYHRAQQHSDERALPTDLRYPQGGRQESGDDSGKRDDVWNDPPVVVDGPDHEQRRAQNEASDRAAEVEIQVEIQGGYGQADFREEVAERN